MKKQVCKHCGSPDIWVDACAVWSEQDQAWELSTVFDNAYCNDCEGETYIREVKESVA